MIPAVSGLAAVAASSGGCSDAWSTCRFPSNAGRTGTILTVIGRPGRGQPFICHGGGSIFWAHQNRNEPHAIALSSNALPFPCDFPCASGRPDRGRRGGFRAGPPGAGLAERDPAL